MAAKLENCTKEEQPSVIHFCGQKLLPGGEIHQHIVLSMGTMLSLEELCVSGPKGLKMAV
jgi:hypothetical protein